MNLNTLKALGFDKSRHIPFTEHYRLGCSQCSAASINGCPTHENGCPNQKYECKGCNNIIGHRGYCSDCS